MDWIIQIIVLVLAVCLAYAKSLLYQPNGLSDFELQRLIRHDDKAAHAEQYRRSLLPTYIALRSLKEVIFSAMIAALLLSTYGWLIGAVLTIGYLFAAHAVAARGWLSGFARYTQQIVEPRVNKYVQAVRPVFAWLAPASVAAGGSAIASRDELRQLIAHDTQLLAPQDKARLLGAFDFGSLLVADAMVPRDQIVTVDIKETIGPVLLDRLHKQKHNMYVVIKHDLDNIRGLLYMHDLTPLDPDLKEVKDAIRPTVHYVPAHAALQDVLAASLHSGRQLFVVVDDHGKTKGLITLADALAHLNGEPLPKTAPVSTKPDVLA